MDDKTLLERAARAVPLMEQLRSVPVDAVLRIDTPNALGCMDTHSIPVGRICHEAANALDAQTTHAPQGCADVADFLEQYAVGRAADFLEQYADFIRRDVMFVDIERHPYLPELEEVAAEIRAAASLAEGEAK